MAQIFFDSFLQKDSDTFISQVIDNSFKFDISCFDKDLEIDYLALYTDLKDYKRKNTAVCFYQDDIYYDGIGGLFNAIYYKDEKLINKFYNRFKNNPIILETDYSLSGDVHLFENLFRKFKGHYVIDFMKREWNKIVIPQVSFVDKYTKKIILKTIKPSSVVCLSTKGMLKENSQLSLFNEIIDTLISDIKPSVIYLYNVAVKSQMLKHQINRLKEANIKVIIPSNKLLLRNLELDENKESKEDEYGLF